MKRINLKFLLILVTALVVGIGGIYFLRRFQVSRNAGNLAKMAKERLAEGKAAEAIALYGRYIGLRPEDDEAYAEFAKLMLGRAEAPDATRNDMARAYNTLESAVRRSPENDDLRRRLAEFQIRIGRATDAREHLAVLRERLDAGLIKDTPPADDTANGADTDKGDDTEKADEAEKDRMPLDARLIQLLTARALMGSNDFEDAAKSVA